MVQFYINGVIISSICPPDRHSLLTPWQLHSLTTDVGGLVPLLARLEIQTLNSGFVFVSIPTNFMQYHPRYFS